MDNSSENYRQYQAAKAYSPRPVKPGRINGKPTNVVRDPYTGDRIGVTRRDGSFIPMGPEMGRAASALANMERPTPSYMQSRASRVAAAMRDGTFQRKRDAYNRASNNYMDEYGNIEIRRDPTPKITTDMEGNKKLESAYGTGSARPASARPGSTQPSASQLTIKAPVGMAAFTEQPKVPVQDPNGPMNLRDFGDAKALDALSGNSGLPTITASPEDMFRVPSMVSATPQSPAGTSGQAQGQPVVATTPPPKKPERNASAGVPIGGPRRK